jgi:hypothetical protein
MAVFLFEKTNSVLSSFPGLENKQKSYFFPYENDQQKK